MSAYGKWVYFYVTIIMDDKKMKNHLIFPTILIVLSVCAGIVYALKGDARHAVYWFAAATLNAAVTY